MQLKLSLMALFLCLRAGAVPTLYPDKFNTQVKNNTDSGLVPDSVDSNRFYVLPPQSASATVQGLHTVTANVGFCKEIAEIQKYNLDTLDLINSLKLQENQISEEINAKKISTDRLAVDLAKFVSEQSLQELYDLDRRVQLTDQRLNELYLKMNICRQNCGLIAADIEDSRRMRNELLTKRFELSASRLASVGEYEKRKKYLESVNEELNSKIKNVKQLQSDLRGLYSDFVMMFDAHAQREGGRVAINYESRWWQNVLRLKADNPQISFEKIATKNALLRADAYSKKNLIIGGAVLAFDVGGIGSNSVLSLESYPENFSGNAVLNLLSVCPMLHPEWFDIDDRDIVDRQKMNFGLTVAYEYPSEFKYELNVRYNLYKMYEIVKEQGVSGGFLNSRSWSDQQEQEVFQDSFDVDWKVQADGKVFSEEQKLSISSDLRRQMLSRLAGHLVMHDKNFKLDPAPPVPENGAVVLSNSISKACPLNILCRGASLMLNVVQAVFRSNQSEQKLRQQTDVNMFENYRSRQVILQPMLSSYR